MNVLKHYKGTQPPTTDKIAVGEIVLRIDTDTAELYTKDFTDTVLTIGKGVTKFIELEDLDLTNLKDGSFIVRQGDKFIAISQIGNLNSLTDVEITNPVAGDYLRYDSVFQAFKNFKPSYNLYELTDVEVANPNDNLGATLQNNKVLYYDHASGKFKMRDRTNFINELADVEISQSATNQILALDTDGIWKNKPLEIVRDTAPVLSANLDANYKNITNSTYKVSNYTANVPILNLSYADGDYFIITGVSSTVNPQCIVTIDYSTLPNNSSFILMLEIRQSTGLILIGGLENVKYEDGRPVQLSGAGKIDLLTINIQKLNNIVTNYVTTNALNLATLNQGGVLANRYDKFRYPEVQLFDNPNRYDDYFDYVQLLLNFEAQVSTAKLWYEDKSIYNHNVTKTATQLATNIYTFGIQEYVALFSNISDYITVITTNNIVLDADFTYEFFVNYPENSDYISTTDIIHYYFKHNQPGTFNLYYTGSINTRQSTKIVFELGTNTYTYLNAFHNFDYFNKKYVHIAIVRNSTEILLFINGVYQNPIETPTDIDITLITLEDFTFQIKGNLNSVRVSKYARYTNNFLIPAMRFGLVGGYHNFLEKLVFDIYPNIAEIEDPIANMMFT